MGKVMLSGIVPYLVSPVSYKANFADNTWAQIIDACQKNAVPDTWLVGDQKNMTINGTDYAIDIIGKNHDTYSDGSGTAPLTFQLHDCYGTKYQMHTGTSNRHGWHNCNMRNVHLPSILALMPSEVQDGIREVNKKTSAGNKSTTLKTTADKLFLLSEKELRGRETYAVSGEGIEYEYYAAGNSKVKTFEGSASVWRLRSPAKDSTTDYCRVSSAGSYNRGTTNAESPIAFAFCF